MDQSDTRTQTEVLPYPQGGEDFFEAAVKSSRIATVITDPHQPDNPIIFANSAFQKATGYGAAEMLGRNCRFLQGPGTDSDAIATLREAVANGTDARVTLLNYRKDGSAFWNVVHVSPIKDEQGELRYFVASQFDITDRVEAQDALQHEVDHRVKNNMTVVGSLLRLHLREARRPEIVSILRAMVARVDALAALHRHLYQAGEATSFDVGAFACSLAREMAASLGEGAVRLRADLDRADIPVGHASVVGLIVNEVLGAVMQGGSQVGEGVVVDLGARTQGDCVYLIMSKSDRRGGCRLTEPVGLSGVIIARLAAQAQAEISWTHGARGDQVQIKIKREL